MRCTPDCFGATLLRSGLNIALGHSERVDIVNEQIAALVLLIVIASFAAYVVSRLQNEQLKDVLLSSNVIVISGALFCLLLIVQLLKEQSWMPDLLKVVAGVVAGAIAAKKVEPKQTEEQKLQQIAVGEQIQQAARDINNVQSALNKIEKSIVNQFNSGKGDDDVSVVAYQESERIDINYRNNADVTAEYERISREHPDDFRFKPIRGEQVREWYDRKVKFFAKIPGAMQQLHDKVQEIREAGWELRRFGLISAASMSSSYLQPKEKSR